MFAIASKAKESVLTKLQSPTGVRVSGIKMDIQGADTMIAEGKNLISTRCTHWAADAEGLVSLVKDLTVHYNIAKEEIFLEKHTALVEQVINMDRFRKISNGSKLLTQWLAHFRKINMDGYGLSLPMNVLKSMGDVAATAVEFCEFSIVMKVLTVELPVIVNNLMRTKNSKAMKTTLTGQGFWGEAVTLMLEKFCAGENPRQSGGGV